MKMYKKCQNAAKAKSNLVNTNFFKYFVRAVMAGFFIDMAMIYSDVHVWLQALLQPTL